MQLGNARLPSGKHDEAAVIAAEEGRIKDNHVKRDDGRNVPETENDFIIFGISEK